LLLLFENYLLGLEELLQRLVLLLPADLEEHLVVLLF